MIEVEAWGEGFGAQSEITGGRTEKERERWRSVEGIKDGGGGRDRGEGRARGVGRSE